MTVLSFLQRPLPIRVPSPAQAAVAVVARAVRWQDGWRQRKHLAELDDRLLADIGLTRDDVRTELSRRTWW